MDYFPELEFTYYFLLSINATSLSPELLKRVKTQKYSFQNPLPPVSLYTLDAFQFSLQFKLHPPHFLVTVMSEVPPEPLKLHGFKYSTCAVDEGVNFPIEKLLCNR